VVTKGSVVVWESWEARETMVMSMSSLETPPHTGGRTTHERGSRLTHRLLDRGF
jgi:hypothetical protein